MWSRRPTELERLPDKIICPTVVSRLCGLVPQASGLAGSKLRQRRPCLRETCCGLGPLHEESTLPLLTSLPLLSREANTQASTPTFQIRPQRLRSEIPQSLVQSHYTQILMTLNRLPPPRPTLQSWWIPLRSSRRRRRRPTKTRLSIPMPSLACSKRPSPNRPRAASCVRHVPCSWIAWQK